MISRGPFQPPPVWDSGILSCTRVGAIPNKETGWGMKGWRAEKDLVGEKVSLGQGGMV